MIRKMCNHCEQIVDFYFVCSCERVYCWDCVYAWQSTLRPERGPNPTHGLCCSLAAEWFYLTHAPLEELPLLMAYEVEEPALCVIKDRLAGRKP